MTADERGLLISVCFQKMYTTCQTIVLNFKPSDCKHQTGAGMCHAARNRDNTNRRSSLLTSSENNSSDTIISKDGIKKRNLSGVEDMNNGTFAETHWKGLSIQQC